MASPIVVAQATTPPGTGGTPPRVITVSKPQGEQAITIHLDGATKLDLSAIANEQITLVHLGDRLIILFDNHAEVTIEPFYADNGQPLPDITVELGPGRDVSGADFAGMFPVTTDASVLPASGGPGSVSSGADFASFTIDTFAPNGTGLPLLTPQPTNVTGTESTAVVLSHTVPQALTNATINATVDEGGLGAIGNDQGLPFTATGVAGSLNALASFGTGGPAATPFQFVAGAAANAWLASLGLTSHDASIDTATITGHTLVASTDPGQPNPHDVFSLTINNDGSWTFTLLAPLDEAAGGGENTATIDLSGLIQAVDASGLTITFANDFKITVTDDVPVLTANVASGGVDESALTNPPDTFGPGQGGGTTTATGDLTALGVVLFGADGPATQTVGLVTEAAGFRFAVANGDTHDFGVQSHGQEVNFVTVVDNAPGPDGLSQTLTAWTNGGPTHDPASHEVFTLTLNGDGTYTFTLLSPLDDNGDDTTGFTLDLAPLVNAVDHDGDATTLAGDFNMRVTNDVPAVIGTINATGQVDEGALVFSSTPTSGDLYGDGNDHALPGAGLTATGTVAGLVAFGADGPAFTTGGLPAGFRIAIADGTVDSTLVPLVRSHGELITFFTVSTAPDGASQTLTAFAGGSVDDGGHAVFTLQLNGDGSYVFTLVNPIDEAAPGDDTTQLDLSNLIKAVDFDGNSVNLLGHIVITVTDDVPVVNTAATAVTGAVDEGGLTAATDTHGTGNDPGFATSASALAGSLQPLVHFGADGANATAFQLVDQTTASSFLLGQSLSSHGFTVDHATVVGSTLTALDTNNDTVFTLTVNGDGSWTFNLLQPLDETTGSPEKTTTIDLSGLVQAFDFDGDTVTLANDFKITVTDDAPIANGGNSPFASVEEGPLQSGHSNPPLQTVTEAAGTLNAITSFGADGANATAFNVVDAGTGATALASLNLTSNGIAINGASVAGNVLTALDANNNHIFTLTVGADGSFTFDLLAPIDQVPVNGQFNLDLSGLIEAIDFDGSATALGGDHVQVTINDNRPVVSAVHDTGDEYTPHPPSANTPGTQTSIPLTLSETDAAPGVTITFTVNALPANGTLYLSDGTTPVVAGTAYAATGTTLDLVFKPAAFFAGSTSFQYIATDSNGASSPSPATATIDVTPIADPPVIANSYQADLVPADSTTSGSAQMAALAGGGFVEVWPAFAGGQSTVYGQVFNASGQAVGSEHPLATGITSPVSGGLPFSPHPLVVALNGGGFAVTWTDNGHLFEQTFNADGTQAGTVHQIDVAGTSPFAAQLLAVGNGFAIVYQDAETSKETVHTRLFGADGTPFADQTVNTTPPNDAVDTVGLPPGEFAFPTALQIASLPDGYAVGWSSVRDNQEIVLIRAFHGSDGSPATSEIQVGTPPAGANDIGFTANGTNAGALIASQPNGDIAVVWERQFSDGSTEIMTRLFHAADNYAGGAEVQAGAVSTNSGEPDIAEQIVTLANGGYAVLWSQGDINNPSVASIDTYIQVFDANGHLADFNSADHAGILVDDSAATGAGTSLPEQVLALSDGRLAVMWGSGFGAGDVFIRVFNPDGTAVDGHGAMVNPTAADSNTQYFGAQMIAFADGGFAVVYDQAVGNGTGGNQDHLFVQQYDSDGNPVGTALELSTTPLAGLGATEFSDFQDFRVALSQEGVLLTGGTVGDNSAFGATDGTFTVHLTSLDTAVGIENKPIALFNASIPSDPTETLKLTITGVPAGASFEINGTAVGGFVAAGTYVIDGTSSPTVAALVALLGTDPLTLVSPTSGTFTLNVDVQSIDTATLSTGPVTSTHDTTGTFTVTIADANDVTLGNPASATTLAGGGPIALGIAAPVDADTGNDLTITISAVPSYGIVQYTDASNHLQTAVDGTVLTSAELQTLTFSAALGTPSSTGDALVYSVQDGANLVNGTIALSVIAGADVPVVTNVEPASISGADTFHGFDLHQVALTGGGFVEVWTATTFVNPPDHSLDVQTVFAQVMDANGQPVGGPIAVGANAGDLNSGHGDPKNLVVALTGGGFAVSWVNGDNLFIQAYDQHGNLVGGSLVDTGGGTGNVALQLNATSDGGFAVLYERFDGTQQDVYTQVFSASGAPSAAGEQHVNNTPPGDGGDFLGGAFGPNANAEPNQMATLPDGYAVIWNSFRDGTEVNLVRVFNNDGTPATNEMQVSTPPTGANDAGFDGNAGGLITALANGDFAVFWTRFQPDGSADVMTKIYHATDNFAGGPEVVTSSGDANGGSQELATQIVTLATGGYAVLWAQIDGTGNEDAFVQIYDANGHLTNPANAGGILVDTPASGTAFPQQVLALANGDFAVMWNAGGVGPDNTFVSVFNPEGGVVAGPTQVNPHAADATATYSGEQMVAFGDGGFAVIYDQTVTSGAGPTHQDHLFAQQYDANGVAVGGPLELAASPFTGANPTEFSSFLDFRASLSNEGLLLGGGTTNDDGSVAITLGAEHSLVGAENTPIALVNISVASPATETLTVTLSGFPPGATFEANGTPVGAAGAGNTWVISNPAEVALLATNPLTLIPPSGFFGTFNLTVDALDTKTVGAQTSTAETIKTYDVSITDTNDVTLSNPSAVSVTSGAGAVALNIGAPSDPDQALGENDVITIQAVPGYGTVQYFDGATWLTAVDGTVLTAAELQTLQYVAPASGSFHGDSVVYSVQDGASLVDGSIAITVADAGGGLYFSADDPELFTLDSHGNLTSIPVNPGNPNGSFAGEDGGFIQFANGLYFNANRDDTGEVLFRLGADNVAHPVTDANGHHIGGINGVSADYKIYNGSLYFIAEGSTGTDLFKIDPTGAVTEFNLNLGAPSNNAFDQFNNFGLTEFDGKLFFTAYSATSTNFDKTALFEIDPNSNVANEVTNNGQSLDNAGEDGGFFTFNGGLFFNAFDPIFGESLFELDANGQPAVVKDGIFPIPHVTGETTYFQTLGQNLYLTEETSGSVDGLFQVTPGGAFTEIQYGTDSFDFTSAVQAGLGGIANFNGHLYFSAETPTTDAAIFADGGFNPNPVLFALNGSGTATPVTAGGHDILFAGEDGGFVTFNNNLYFFGDEHAGGTALYQIDGGGNVTEVEDPTSPGNSFGAPGTTAPNQPGPDAHFTVFDGSLYFEAFTGKGEELVQIDSTGTAHVIDINPQTVPFTGSGFPGEDGGFGVYTPIATAFGTAGNDHLTGGANTVFIGGKGNDTIHGAGLGANDTAVIDANFGDPSTHVSLSGGTVTVTYTSGANTYTDTLTGIDRIQFADKGLLIVDPTGQYGFTHVQDAVNAATEGDTIWVLPGTYSETFTPLPFSATPGGLYVDTPNLTLQGVDATGTPITNVTDANKGALPLIISGAQTDFGSNIFVGPNADNTTIQGLHLQAGPQTDNKLLEIWANNATVENNFLDTNIGGTVPSGAIAIYFNDNGTTFTDEIDSYAVTGNILTDGVLAANGVGIAGTVNPNPNEIISGNTFEGSFDISTGQGRYDTIVINGQVPGIGWLLESTQIPTVTLNQFGDNTTPFLLRGSDNNLADIPTKAQVEDFLGTNGDADTTYAYAVTPGGNLEVATRDIGSGTFYSFAVTNTLDTLELALESNPNGNTVFSDQRFYVLPGDTVVIQSGPNPLTSAIDVNNLFVKADQDSAHLTLTMATQLADGEPIPGAPVQTLTLVDYVPTLGANVNVVANDLGDTITGNSGDNVITGGAGIDHLAGGAGNDTYYVRANDVVTEGFNQGIDEVRTPDSYTLPANVENLTLLDSAPGPSDFQNFNTMPVGPITNGENGWEVLAGGRDQGVVDLGGGNHAFKMSSDPSVPDFAGPYSPALSAAAGEPDTGALYNGESISFVFQAVNPSPDGSRLEIDFGNAAGTDRNNFLVLESFPGIGVRIAVSEPDQSGNFSGDGTDPAPNDWRELATNVDPTVAHTLEMRLTYVDGPNNDRIEIYLDGHYIGTTTTFENYHDALNGLANHIASAIANETDRTFFRPSANGAPQDGPGGQNQGFLIDALTNSVYEAPSGTGNNLDNVITGNSADNIITGGLGDDTLFGNGGDDTFIYNVGDGQDTVDGGSGTDIQVVNNLTATPETFNINPLDATHLGVNIDTTTTAATFANAEISMTNVEELELHLGSGGDTVVINGNMGLTGIAQSTITVDGGTGADTVDATGMSPVYPVDVVFNGGGGNDVFKSGPGNDTFIDTGSGRAVYSETLTAASFGFSAGYWTVTTATEGHDRLQGVSAVDDGSIPGHHFLLVGAGSQYATIQQAIDASHTGDTILIAPGTYTGQYVVDPTHGHGADGISIVGIGSVTLDAPASLVSEGTSPTSGRDIDGILTVSNAHNVTIENISVNGLHEGANVTGATDPTLVGIAYLNASGTVDHVDVTGIRESDAGFGDQRGIAIYASNTAPVGPPTQSFTLTDSTIEDWQKGAVVAINTNVDIEHNTITGAGATGATAQNGIELVDAPGTVSNNALSGIGYIVPPGGIDYTATGILFFNTAGLTVGNNVITGGLDLNHLPVSQTGIYGLDSSNITIHGNQIANGVEGIVALDTGTGGFAPTWDIGPTNLITNYTQQALDFEADPGNAHSFNVVGTDGNDLFIGGAGTDTFAGGDGNDVYYVHAGDTVIEQPNQGTDEIRTVTSFTLPANVENLTLLDSSTVVSNTQTFDNMTLGPITNGENGWEVLAGGRDQGIVDLGGTHGHVFKMSSDPSVADFAGPYSPELTAKAGEPDTGAAYNGQMIDFQFKAVSATPDGSRLEIDFGNAAGTDRNNFLVIESFAGTGIRIAVSEPDTSGNFSGNGVDPAPNDWRQLISGVDPTQWHDLQMRLTYNDGPNNDVIQVYLDGQLIGTTTTFENYHDASNALGHIANAIANETDRVFFRPSANGAPQDGAGGSLDQGFYFDNLTTAVYNTANNIDGTGNNLDNVITGNSGDNVLTGGGGNDTINAGAGFDTIVYNVADGGRETVDGGTGIDTQVVNNNTASAETFNINAIDATHVGINIEPGANNVVAATNGNAEISDTNIEEIVVHLGSAGDTVHVTGNLNGSGLLTSTVTVDGGAGNDTVDASGIDPAYPVGIVFNGGGGDDTFVGGPGTDTAVYSTALTAASFSYDSAHGNWTVSAGADGTDTLHGVEHVTDNGGHRFLLVGGGSQYATIQAAVNAAVDGDTIVLAGGTYHENVVVDGKAVNIEGLGGANGFGGAVLDGSITETGALNANMTIEGLIIDATGQQNGISLTPTLTGPETVTINDVAISGASQTGLIVNGGGTDLTANVSNSSFTHNGIAKSSGGSGDITYFEFLGNAAFTNVQVTGAPRGTNLANAGDNGIQIAGFDEGTKAVTNPLGNVTFDNVSVTGTYAKTLVYIQGYDDASNLHFTGTGLTLGDATTQTGWTSMFVDLGPQLGSYAFAPTPSVDLAGVTLAGWSFATGGSAAFQPLAAAGLDDLIVGTPNTTDITGTPNNDAIAYTQQVGGIWHVDGGAGTDALIVTATPSAVETFNINPIAGSPTELGIEIAAGANNAVTATAANSSLITTNVEEIVLNLNNAGDTVLINGDLHGTGVATSTVTINGGTGNDTVDFSGMTGTPVDVVFNGNGGNDTAVFAGNSTGYTFSVSGTSLQVHGTGVTDTLSGIQTVKFADATVLFVDNGSGAGHYNGAFTTIAAALAAAASITGPVTIEIAAGTYHENVNVTQSNVTLVGQGDSTVIEGTFKSSNGIADGQVATFLESGHGYVQTAGSGVTLSGSNDSVQNLKIDSFTYGVSLTDGINGDSLKNVDFTDNLVGIKKGTTAGITNFTVTGGSISDGLHGIDFDKTTTPGQAAVGMADHVTIDGTSFSNLAYKGIYLETLSNGLITNVTMDNVGQFGAPSTSGATGSGGDGIDLNLKNGVYTNDVISNFHLTDTGASNQNGNAPDHQNGGAIVIEARDDGATYGAAPASYTGAVTIENGIIDGTTSTGIQAGEPGKSNLYPDVNVSGVTITGADNGSPLHGDVANVTQSTFSMTMASGDDSLLASPTTTGNMVITANNDSNVTIVTGGGNDTVITGTGTESITGGAGTDMVKFAGIQSSAATFAIAGGHWTVTVNGVTDTLTGIEKVQFADKTFELVDQTGANVGGFQSVAAAVGAASGGETILIAPGTYSESATWYGTAQVGLYINKPNLTLQGVASDGTLIASGAAADTSGPTIVAAHQTDPSGASFFIDTGGTGTTLDGLHLKAGPESTNKLVEFSADGVSIENSYIDTIPAGGSQSAAAAVYIDTVTPGTISSYLIDGNVLSDGIYVANGVGHPAVGAGFSPTEMITNNSFVGTFTQGRYDMVAVQGQIPGIGWQPDAAQVPTIGGNTRADNSSPFIFRMTEANAALFPTTAEIQQIVSNNTDASTTYAYVLDQLGNPQLVDRDIGAGPFHQYGVANSLDTLNLGLDSTADAVFPDQRIYMVSGDTVVVQSGTSEVNSTIMVDNLTIEATANSSDLDLTLGTNFADGTVIPSQVTHLTLADLTTGVNLDVTGNDFGDTITVHNSGSDKLVGGTGIDTALYGQPLATTDFSFSGGAWHVGKTGGASDTLTAFEKVTDSGGHHFLLVGGGSQYATIQAAVNAASDGDTILIAPGSYTENVTINSKGLTIEGIGTTTLHGSITETGTLNSTLTIGGIAIDATGQQDGVLVTANSHLFEGAVVLDHVSIANAVQNGFAYIEAGNGSTPTHTDTIGSVSILDTTFTNDAPAVTGANGRGDILLFGFNGDLTVDHVMIDSAGAGAQKAIQLRGVQDGFDVAGVGPYHPGGDISLTDLDVSGTYHQDLLAFYNYASFASFTANGVTLDASAPWGLMNFDGVGGTVDLSSGFTTLTNLSAGAPIGSLQGLATGDHLTGTFGDDVFVGRGGSDVLSGGGGNDTFLFTAAQFHGTSQTVDGGTGSDTIAITDTAAPITILDADLVNVSNVETLKLGGSGLSTVTLGANADADALSVGGSTFTLDVSGISAPGGVTLDASAMSQTLKVLLDSIGNDVLTGSGGTDIYQFNAPTGATSTNTISNFDNAGGVGHQDQFAVSATGFGGGLTAGQDVTQNGVFETSNDANFQTLAGRFHFDTANNGLYYSVDGTTSHEVLLATVTNATVAGHDIHVVA